MKVTLQPFFIFYASRLKEVVRINIADAPPGEPTMTVIHHESKASIFTSTPSSRFKDRMLQVAWAMRGTTEEQNINFVLPLCAYGNESLRLNFKWPTGEEIVTKPIMITSSEQILQALAKYNFAYRMLTMEERFSMLNELQQVEWKLGRPFDPVEIASLDNYFGSDLERILSWLTDRMKLVCESPELIYLWNKGYLMACDDERIRAEMNGWFQSWSHSLASESATDPASAERLAVLTSMSPKTFALRIKMSGKTPLAFTMCNEMVRHRLEVVNNILSTLAKADLQCLYNIRLKQVDMLQNVLIESEYRDVCPSADGYYEEFDGNSWASVSFSTFNSLSHRTKELEDALKQANMIIASRDAEIAFLQGELERMRSLSQSSLPLAARGPGGSAITIRLPAPQTSPLMAQMNTVVLPLPQSTDSMTVDDDADLLVKDESSFLDSSLSGYEDSNGY